MAHESLSLWMNRGSWHICGREKQNSYLIAVVGVNRRLDFYRFYFNFLLFKNVLNLMQVSDCGRWPNAGAAIDRQELHYLSIC
jgi:hypothetical protein